MLLNLPSNRTEGWRWSDVSALPEIAASTPSGQVPEALPWIDCGTEGPRLLFVDGRFVAERSNLGTIGIGAVDAPPGDHALARLVGREGWKLRLDKGRAPQGLVQIVHVSTGAANHLAAEIELDVDAEASVVETFIGQGWANRLSHFRLFRGARLMLARRLLGTSGYVSLVDRAAVGEGASFILTTLAAGGTDTRLDAEVRIAGAGGYAEVGGALLARGNGRHDANAIVRHEAVGGVSRQLWRSVAADRSTCSVAARVEVARAAQKTDGEQSLKGLLLDRGATINAKPELEIFADDVKCAHGATVGELNRDALFYLASRGVPVEEAKALLTQAFVADAIARIGEEAVREAFQADALAWLNKAPLLKALPLDGGGLGGGGVSGNAPPFIDVHPHPASPIEGEGR